MHVKKQNDMEKVEKTDLRQLMEDGGRAAELLAQMPDSPERDGLLALLAYCGEGQTPDCEKAFLHARRGMEKGDGAACYVLGLMCANCDTPDQRTGGERQLYDHYDAETFMERAAQSDSPWAVDAHLWLGDYFMDSCRGEDPEEGLAHYRAAAESDSVEAAEFLADYYDERAEWENFENEELNRNLYDCQRLAYELNPHDNARRYGLLLALGIGCRPSFRLARKCLEEDYAFGHPEGAAALAFIWKRRAADAGLPKGERACCAAQAEKWEGIAARHGALPVEPEEEVR